MTKTILVLAANPKDTSPLRLDQEIREIDNGLERSQKRDDFILKLKLAARPVDVRRAMLDYQPNIVHFCGHGAGEEGIAFEDDSGQSQLVNSHTLSGFFRLFAKQVECIVLNACYSEVQAEAIAKHIQYVVGMKKEIGDRSAIEFAVAFYDALGAGKTYEFAFEIARNAIQWTGIPESLTPVLKKKTNLITDNSKQSQNEDQIKLAIINIINRLEQRKGKRASFLAIREEVNVEYTDEFIMDLIDKNSKIFRKIKVKRGEQYITGITLASEYQQNINETDKYVQDFHSLANPIRRDLSETENQAPSEIQDEKENKSKSQPMNSVIIFNRLQELINYAQSANGLNKSKLSATAWAEEYYEYFSAHDFEKFKILVEYASSADGLNKSKLSAAAWAFQNIDRILLD